MIDRRAFIAGTGASILAAPLASAAEKARRIGFLQPGEAVGYMDAFRQSLAELGWVERQNVIIDHRISAAPADYAAIMTEFIRLEVDVIITWSTLAVMAAKRATTTIPIVGISGNPVELGLAASLARPGGNLTGIAILGDDVEVKNLELLTRAVPAASRIAVLVNPDNPVWGIALKRLRDAGVTLGVKVLSIEVRGPADLDKAFATARSERADGMLVVNEPQFRIHRRRIAALAEQYRLPAIYGSRTHADAGGLMSHAASLPAMLRRAGVYVDKILKGAKPGDLPIEQPTKFELVINLKTAKALGLTIPPSLLLRADQVIE